MRLPIALLLGLALTACAGVGERPPADPSDADAPQSAPELRAHAYRCEDGSRIVAEQRPEGGIYLFFPASNVALEQVPAASGARYRGRDGVEFWDHGRAARVVTADGQELRCTEDRIGSLVEDARLRGIDFIGLGNEPGWRLELGPRRTTLITDYGRRTLRFPARAVEAGLAAEETVTLTLRHDDHRLALRLAPIPCQDDMSGRRFDWQVNLELDGQTLRGCGVALH